MTTAPIIAVREIRENDLHSVIRLQSVSAPTWNQTAEDWRLLIDRKSNECLCIKKNRQVIASATAYVYGPDLAWIGMVLVHPRVRRRGLGLCILEELIRRLGNRGVSVIKLDATDMGIGLYRRLGFVEQALIERWERPPTPATHISKPAGGNFVVNASLDRRAFGVDRVPLLARLSQIESLSLGESGFAMGRRGKHAAYFGPCVAESASVAEELLGWFIRRHWRERIYWDIVDCNKKAAHLAREFGFSTVRRLTRMSLCDRELEADPCLVYATAGFEYG